ncbi:MAG: hypothetical protein R3246_03720 [Acidimicrobiia bacterium]|nr:hypothetical protein [Acidimicrobiia bacterium]
MPAPEMLDVIRVVATPHAIASLESDGTVLQVAPDEALVLDATDVAVDDPHAIVVADDGYVGVQLDRRTVEDWCQREADWPLPELVSYFTQGMVAGLAVKIWMNGEVGLVMCRTSLAAALEDRL